jgi:PTS system ascorbate-specific IIB component
MLKVVAICGCGMGSSVILRMNAEKAFKDLDVKAKVEVADATTGKGAARDADLIIISKELGYLFKDYNKPMIQLKSFVDKREIKDKLVEFLKNNNLK